MATTSVPRTTNNGAAPIPGTVHVTFAAPSSPPKRRHAKNHSQNQAPTTRSWMAEIVSNNSGMLYIASSQLFFALQNLSVKKLNSIDPPVPAFELIWVRMAITWVCCLSYMKMTGVPNPILGPKEVRWLLALRGFVGFFGLFGMYYSLQYLSLSDATVLSFLAPMCTTVTGALFLGEGFAWGQAAAGLFSLLGVVLIARPQSLFGPASLDSVSESAMLGPIPTPSQRLMAVGVALIGVLGATGAYTTIRAIGKRAHAMHNLVAFSTQCLIVSPIAMIILRTPVVIPTRLDWVAMLLAIGILGFIAQILLTVGLQREAVGRGTMAVYVQIVFATALQEIFFHTTPSFLSITGTIIIMSSAIYVAVTKETGSSNKQKPKVEDISLEEGLLENQEEDEIDDELPAGKGGQRLDGVPPSEK